MQKKISTFMIEVHKDVEITKALISEEGYDSYENLILINEYDGNQQLISKEIREYDGKNIVKTTIDNYQQNFVQVTELVYENNIVIKQTEYFNNNIFSIESLQYDSQNRIKEITKVDGSCKLIERKLNEYYDKKVTLYHYDEKNQLLNKLVKVHDTHGNLIETVNVDYFDKEVYHPEDHEIKTFSYFKYDKNNNLIEEKTHRHDRLVFSADHVYDSRSNYIQSEIFDFNLSYITRIINNYNDENQLIREQVFRNDLLFLDEEIYYEKDEIVQILQKTHLVDNFYRTFKFTYQTENLNQKSD